VPYSNRIANAELTVGGEVYALARKPDDPQAIHGVGWRHAWRTLSHDAGHAELDLAYTPERRQPGWPFAFRAQQSFALETIGEAVMLSIGLAITNEDTRVFPAGLGFHPWFVRRPQTTLAFGCDRVWLTDGSRLPTELVPPPSRWQFAEGRTLEGVDVDNVFTGWDGVARIGWPEQRVAVTLSADASLSHLVVFVPPDRPAFAVEPVSHMTDAFNRAADGREATGFRALAPGQTFAGAMRIGVRSAA
jgi:aldose 1-epimerase